LQEYRYLIFGYRLAMPCMLPDFEQCLDPDPESKPDVQLQFKPVPQISLDTFWTSHNTDFGIGPGGFEIKHPVLGRILVQKGRKIMLQPGMEKYGRLIRTLLSNTLMPVVSLQRGQIPLHASIVRIENQLTAFIGGSGAGKSTLAAQLHARGESILTEDIGVIEVDDRQRIWVRPGIPYFRLWQDAMQHLGIDPDDHPRVWQNRSKHHVPLFQAGNQKWEQLRRIYVLEDSPTGEIEICSIKGFEAIQAVISAVPFNILQHSQSLYRNFFEQSVALTRQISCYRLRRPRDFSLSERLLQRLHQHASKHPVRGDSE
jgi:hypothetical protein